MACVELVQLAREEDLLGAARAVQVDDVVQLPAPSDAAQHAMIGVMPLPALTNSSRSGSGSGSTNVPSTPPKRTIVPGRTPPHRNGETLPAGTSLGVIAMRPSARSGSEVSE